LLIVSGIFREYYLPGFFHDDVCNNIRKSVVTASADSRLQLLRRVLNISIVPLLIAFILIVVYKVAEMLNKNFFEAQFCCSKWHHFTAFSTGLAAGDGGISEICKRNLLKRSINH
jgi:hypothetical protein